MRVTVLLMWMLGAACAVTPARAAPQRYEPGVDPSVGFNLISWWNFGATGESVWTDAVQDLYDHGVREVSISPVRFVDTSTGEIAGSSGQGPELAHIAAGVQHAKSLGMRVTLNPFVEPEGFSFWRGQYNPTPGSDAADRFWSDYRRYLVDVAELARDTGADALTVGTELKAITADSGHNTSWSAVINSVDAVFDGALGYAANWDHFTNANLTHAIWENPAIDFLGIDAYFRVLSAGEAAGVTEDPDEGLLDLLHQRWTDVIEQEILPFADARQNGAGLPVVFTEYGLSPFDRTITQNANASLVDTAEQRMGFQALLESLDGRAEDLPAVHFWQWGMPGAEGSWFFLDPDLSQNIGGGFDESLNATAASWIVEFLATGTAVPGDFDGDGDVDAFDLGIWQSGFGLAQGAAAADGDADGDGDVDAFDLGIWQVNFGAGAALDVPEPVLAGLYLGGLVMAGLSRSRRRWRPSPLDNHGQTAD